MEVSVAEAPLQQANFACELPSNEEELIAIETTTLRHRPVPCLSKADEAL